MSRDSDSSIDEAAPSGGVWALPLLAFGLGLVAFCFIIPATEDTRLVLFERERLRAELEGIQRQVALNDEFLNRIHADRDLALRLAARQRTPHEEDVAILRPTYSLPGAGGIGNLSMSPFALIAAEPAVAPVSPTPPAGGRLAALCREPRTRLTILAIGLFACMLGLLGGGSRASRE